MFHTQNTESAVPDIIYFKKRVNTAPLIAKREKNPPAWLFGKLDARHVKVRWNFISLKQSLLKNIFVKHSLVIIIAYLNIYTVALNARLWLVTPLPCFAQCRKFSSHLSYGS